MTLRKRNLYELSLEETIAYQQMVELIEKVDQIEAEAAKDPGTHPGVTTAIAQELDDARRAFNDSASRMSEKLDNIADFILDMEGSAQAAADEMDRLAKRMKSFQSAENRMREYVLRIMEMRGVETVQCSTVTLRRKENPVTVEITNPEMIPDKLKRVPPAPPPQPDKTAIKEAIKSGETVPGARLFRKVKLVIQ